MSRREFAILICLIVAVAGCARESAPTLAFNIKDAETLRDKVESGVEAGAAGGGAGLGEPTGWATVAGRFTINGQPPNLAPLNVNKDLATCAPGGRLPPNEEVVIGDNNGIKNILLFVSSKLPQDDPKWEHESYLAEKTGEVLFDQEQCVFLSHVQAMRSTQTLRVKNSDNVGHNTKIDSLRGARSANFTVEANKSVLYEPGGASPNPFPVSCSIHPWMSAHLMVCDHPYYKVTDWEGRFEIANLPAGVELEFRVWHERAGYLRDVVVNGEPRKLSRGKFSETLANDQRFELNVQVPNAAFGG